MYVYVIINYTIGSNYVLSRIINVHVSAYNSPTRPAIVLPIGKIKYEWKAPLHTILKLCNLFLNRHWYFQLQLTLDTDIKHI